MSSVGRGIIPRGAVGEYGTVYDIIPGTLRPDGTRRPDIRVKSGLGPTGQPKKYVPEAVKQGLRQEVTVPGLSAELQKEQYKLQEKRQELAERRETEKLHGISTGHAALHDGTYLTDPAEGAKKLRNLNKKLRDIDALCAKKGALDPAQQDKVASRSIVERDIAALNAWLHPK